MRTRIKSLLLKHRTITKLIAVMLIIFSLCINYYVIERAISNYQHLQQKKGVVDMWYSTSMKTTKACLKIVRRYNYLFNKQTQLVDDITTRWEKGGESHFLHTK